MNPPPPPPHGEAPKSSGLPPGKYDIFIIPPHSSGSGFLYLPSLRPNVNSFAAGFASALILVVVGSALAPAVQTWWNSVKGAGGVGMIMLMFAIGVGAWALGRIQNDGGPGPGGGTGGTGPPPDAGAHPGGYTNTQSSGYANGHAGRPPPTSGPPPGAGPMPGSGGAGGPKPTWQRTNTAPPPGTTGATGGAGATPRPTTPKPSTPNSSAKGAWEKAREEIKKREEERKRQEAEKKRREDLERRLKEAREKEAREREAREKKQKEDEEKVAKEKAWKEAKEKVEREREEREKAKKTEGDKPKPPPSTCYAYSAVGEKINPWPRGRPSTPPPAPSPTKPAASPTKKPPPHPSARTYLGTDEDAYSFRPYDKPKRHQKAPSSIYSESSYAASQSTSRTTPPPSHRGPYSTKDPDKVVIKAVYSFNNAFLKTPTSQLVSGVGSVTDGLILRITTEGLFIDDDVRGVPQREWDVKAWTMKLVEVWCPSFGQGPAGNSASARNTASASHKHQNPVRRLWGLDKEKAATPEETDALLIDMLQLCKDNCLHSSRYAPTASSRSSAYYSASSASSTASTAFDDRSSFVSDSAYGSSVGSSSPSGDKNARTNKRGVSSQTGELKSARLHVLRASIRDQEGKKYVFVITEEESWKVAVGLQRLRKGTQVRALGLSGMSSSDARGTLENLGWG
jgi:hypothetical protein